MKHKIRAWNSGLNTIDLYKQDFDDLPHFSLEFGCDDRTPNKEYSKLIYTLLGKLGFMEIFHGDLNSSVGFRVEF